MQVALHAETYFHHVETGMMPQSHWQGYQRAINDYIQSRGWQEFWGPAGPGFSKNFRQWMNEQMTANGLHAAVDPSD